MNEHLKKKICFFIKLCLFTVKIMRVLKEGGSL